MKKIITIVLAVFLFVGCSSTPKNTASIKNDILTTTITDVLKNKEDVVDNESPAATPSNEEAKIDKEKNQEAGETPVVDASKKETPATTPVPPTAVAPSTPDTPTQQKKYVSISIDCKTILNNKDKLEPGYVDFVPTNGIIMPVKKIPIEGNETVMDILKSSTKQNGISMVEKGGYVSSIHNIDEKACGSYSGWMYNVNGEFPNVGASQYKVEDGMSIRWRYTCSMGDL